MVREDQLHQRAVPLKDITNKRELAAVYAAVNWKL